MPMNSLPQGQNSVVIWMLFN